ncbi:SubName: Full=Uncharacterized protein {ECO:0000313/EMBL:CCA66918.1} [Serendipita indica DSM 11827]|uniref:Programmed cell death protein 5 n=1 Tax=Serendipita indica (strain DSM 11827) TaxID=1109443 RepID=G4T6F1_SERID|nr:SubName: Full=Uncharacterized protein {ECO:0000313/EMBL:CCA66918.1} [Serendipita indica DSM 11827]CCA66918.1 hypothetical protein PIIN_00757 [Serendipita indica DSM 11827]
MDISKLHKTAGAQDADESAAKAQKAAQEEQAKRDMLATLLESDARERLNRIALVNPQLSNQVELILVRMFQSGQLRGRVSEKQLIDLLDQADGAQSGSAPKKGSIVFQRRRDIDDDDWDI